MKEVTKHSFCSMDKNSREETCMYLWVEERGKDGKVWKNIIGLDVDDAIKIVDDKEKYTLNNQTQGIVPKYIRGFDEYVSAFISNVYDATDLISSTEYMDYCLKRLRLYKSYMHNNRKICETFFARYMPKSIRQKYHNVWDMIKTYEAAIQEDVKPYYVQMGGGFKGCYTDDWGRRRPLTEPKRWEKRYDYVDELEVCIRKELCNE